MKFLSVEVLGEHQSLTPEGFLLCVDVPIARTGSMYYGAAEIPMIQPDADGKVTVYRDEDEVFKEEFIASFAGKPVVNDHPYEDVTPENWKQYAVGTVMNPRRGSGLQSDLLIADFIITDPEAIEAVRGGKREVSCGYDAEYEELEIGKGRQLNLLANHVALVEAGRCGPRCAIGDSKTVKQPEDEEMKFKDKSPSAGNLIRKRLRVAIKSNDEKIIEGALDEMEETLDEAGVVLHTGDDSRKMSDSDIENRFQSIEKEVKDSTQKIMDSIAELMGKAKDSEAEMAKAKDEEEKKKMEDAEGEKEVKEELEGKTNDSAINFNDSAQMADTFQEVIASAEILVPGIRIPTFDAKVKAKVTLDSLCKLRRTALDLAYNQADTRGMIEDVNGKSLDLPKMSCSAVRSLFKATVALKKASNNSKQNRTADRNGNVDPSHSHKVGKVQTLADLNKFHAEFYSKQN